MTDINDYDRMSMLAIDLYLDYDLKAFPLDLPDVCKRLGIKLVPYSNFSSLDEELLHKASECALYVPRDSLFDTPPKILYNDHEENIGRLRFSIAHEIKHFCNNDNSERNEHDEKMADYFSRFFLCPIPCVIYLGLKYVYEIEDNFRLSYTAACNALQVTENRMRWYGNTIFDYEKPLMKHLYGDIYELLM